MKGLYLAVWRFVSLAISFWRKVKGTQDGQSGAMLYIFRAVFSFTLNSHDNLAVDFLAPLDRVWQHQEASSFIAVLTTKIQKLQNPM